MRTFSSIKLTSYYHATGILLPSASHDTPSTWLILQQSITHTSPQSYARNAKNEVSTQTFNTRHIDIDLPNYITRPKDSLFSASTHSVIFYFPLFLENHSMTLSSSRHHLRPRACAHFLSPTYAQQPTPKISLRRLKLPSSSGYIYLTWRRSRAISRCRCYPGCP